MPSIFGRTVLMVHTSAGAPPPASKHVFQKQGGKWLVVGESAVPAAE
jgi:hypothetical protein